MATWSDLKHHGTLTDLLLVLKEIVLSQSELESLPHTKEVQTMITAHEADRQVVLHRLVTRFPAEIAGMIIGKGTNGHKPTTP